MSLSLILTQRFVRLLALREQNIIDSSKHFPYQPNNSTEKFNINTIPLQRYKGIVLRFIKKIIEIPGEASKNSCNY